MRYLPGAGQMKAADQYTIRTLSVPSLTLMERAAQACVDRIKKREAIPSAVCVVCGSGNNGGDGFAIARMLAEEGFSVTAVMAGNPEHLTKEAAFQKKKYEQAGGRLCDGFSEEEYSIIVDALFGVGLAREISGSYYDLIGKMNACPAWKLAVDIPSGVSADTGAILGTAFRADETVTFQSEKLGLVLYPGKEYAGNVTVADIGISLRMFEEDGKTACMLSPEDYRRMLPVRMPDSNKGTYGRLLMISGSRGMSGAAYLNALGAYRAGAGLVRLYTTEDNREILQGQIPEAVVTTYDLYDERELLRLLNQADVICIGSGIGRSEKSRKIVRTTLENAEVPCVIDADALNLISENPRYMRAFENRKMVLTPHMKEFSYMTGIPVGELRKDRAGVLRAFTEETGVTCILKDARTLVLSGGGRMYINPSGCAAMAKAGAGDVLAGIVAGLLAQGVPPAEGAVLGAWLHGRAGEYAAEKKGRYSLLAREIADSLGYVIKELEDLDCEGVQ
ncbi:MAG: NAD(P)H-hydrate dehydratase [Dorea sp.]|nr:NAD(P)H-hydrate dehydratase [Dorea sp.]